MDEILEFIKMCGAYFLATCDGNQPHVRPFATIEIYKNKIYLQTGKQKNVSKQIQKNGKVELCALDRTGARWIRIEGTLVNDDDVAAKHFMLEQYPALQSMYSETDSNMQVCYFKDATATFYSFTETPRVVKF